MSGDKLKELETEIATYEAARDSRKNREDVEESVRKKFHALRAIGRNNWSFRN